MTPLPSSARGGAVRTSAAPLGGDPGSRGRGVPLPARVGPPPWVQNSGPRPSAPDPEFGRPRPRSAISAPWWLRRRQWIPPLLVGGAAVGAAQALWILDPGLPPLASYAGLALVPLAFLALAAGAVRWEGGTLSDLGFRRRGPFATALTVGALLVASYVALTLAYGVGFGFLHVTPLAPFPLGFALFTAPLTALADAVLFFGYLLRRLARASFFGPGVLVSAVLFAVASTNVPLLAQLSPMVAGQVVVTTTVVNFALGVLLASYLYKSEWELAGPVTFLSALYALPAVTPLVVDYPSWEIQFAASLFAIAVLLLVVGVVLPEPRLTGLPRRRSRNRRRRRAMTADGRPAGARGIWVTGSVCGLSVLAVTAGLPFALGTPTPLLAIASGSMVPTFHRGDLVVIHHVSAASITVGTIIAFSVSCLPSPTVHRVVRIVEGAPGWVYQTKGDANPVQDPCTVPYSAVHGAVAVIVPFLGLLILDPLFLLSIIAVLGVAVVARREGR